MTQSLPQKTTTKQKLLDVYLHVIVKEPMPLSALKKISIFYT